MGKAKMYKMQSIAAFPNVFQNEHFQNPVLRSSEGGEINFKGRWKKDFFKNSHPLVLELACGKGDCAVALAQKNPGKNFIGIDSKGARIFTGAKLALGAGLSNLAFVRMRIENLTNFFEAGEVDEIWITFPDPFPRKGDAKRRLSAEGFLEKYRQICKPEAVVHFKTDDLQLIRFTRESAEALGLKINYYKENIYAEPLQLPELEIKTYYEKRHLAEGRAIHYTAFML